MASRINFDSVNFVVFDIRFHILESCLQLHGLNLSKFSTLLKCVELQGEKIPTNDLARLLHLHPSVMTQVVNDLEKRGLVKREGSPNDARTKFVSALDEAYKTAEIIDAELAEEMRLAFNPDGKKERTGFLTRGLRIGGSVGDMWPADFIEKYPSSTNLTAISIFRRDIEEAMKQIFGISLSEVRIIQRLGEINEPLRVIDLAEQLRILSTTVTRCAAKLEQKKLLKRLASAHDKKAVYLDLTEEGKELYPRVQDELNARGDEYYWGRLSEDDLEVTNKIRGIFLDSIVRQEAESHRKMLDELHER